MCSSLNMRDQVSYPYKIYISGYNSNTYLSAILLIHVYMCTCKQACMLMHTHARARTHTNTVFVLSETSLYSPESKFSLVHFK
jgi:hypothetical protein